MNLRAFLIAVLLVAALLTGYVAWRRHADDNLPTGIARANGRVEATRIEIATQLPGELRQVRAREGDMVSAGEVLAIIDTEELRAELEAASADLRRQEERKRQTEADISRLESESEYALAERDRARQLFDKGYLAKDKLEARETVLAGALAARQAAGAAVDGAEAGIDMARAEIRRLDTLLAHGELRAPREARVQYRLAEPGEILPSGGRVLTLIDLADVYMTVFLPAADSGRLAIGSEARIVFDAAPEWVFPARISFVAPDAQFTPKTVETQSEREKLSFRVKLTVDPALARRFQDQVKPGLRGTAYVMVAREAIWPAWLAPRLPP